MESRAQKQAGQEKALRQKRQSHQTLLARVNRLEATISQLEKEIADLFGLNAAVFDQHGVRITDTLQWANSLCPAVKGNAKGQSFICAVAHQNIAGQAMQTNPCGCTARILKV